MECKFKKTGKFTVSIISQEAEFALFKHFGFQSGKTVDKFEGFSDCERGENGLYYITKGTNAFFSVKVTATQDLGSHTMFAGVVTDMEVLSEVPSVTYDFYMKNIKPKPEPVSIAAKKSVSPDLKARIAGGELQIASGAALSQGFAARIYSMDGRLVKFEALPAGQSTFSIGISDMKSGMYILKIQRDGYSYASTIFRKEK